MKIPAILLLALAGLAHVTFAQTQAEMTEQAVGDLKKADVKLNAAYAEARAALDEEGQKKLKVAQRAWIAFRDAQADLEADTAARGGTMAPLIDAMTRKQLTEDRTSELDELIQTKSGQ
jgi:uncharacterized protein YecT (DUF1311 family)